MNQYQASRAIAYDLILRTLPLELLSLEKPKCY